MKRKGQAAMEFLMTYGWAILVAIVVIGILGYYYFSSDVLTPRAGVVSAPFYLNAHNVDTSTLTLELKNNGGETLNVSNIAIDVVGCASNNTATLMDAGSQIIKTLDCSGAGLSSGDSFSGALTLSYNKQGSAVSLTSSGSVTDTVV